MQPPNASTLPLDATPEAEPSALMREPPPVPAAHRHFFVGIGSSAGGLEALTALLPGLPVGLGLRYVVVQHMSPTHRSMMAQLLGRTVRMPVMEVTDGCVPLADCVYVTPPNNNVVLHEDGSLRLLAPPHETVPKPSVNLFFTSLAETAADRAIGVVLSGTGSDGAVGLHAIKAAGGYAFAQEPGSAKYDGMVRSAIEAGGIDWVLPAEAIGAEIARVVERQRRAVGREGRVDDVAPATLQALLHQLYVVTRIDYTGYKEATLLRRIERRMTATGWVTLDQYVEHCRSHPAELHTLSQDMLISVTSFFRDRVAFERLRETLTRLLQAKPEGEDVRVWVAGCASGEEAYSLAILISDALASLNAVRRVQIFASDIDEAALTRARRAVYPASVVGDLDAATLERHFVPHADGFEVSKAVRSMVMFARHNLVQDPPFVRLDLVSCRNVLIYLQAPLQERVMKTFHYALNVDALLFLGRSEAVHGNDDLFDVVDRAAHLFRRSVGAARLPGTRGGHEPVLRTRAQPRRPTLDDIVQRAMVERFLPASVLVDASGDVRHFKGDLTGLMSLPEGRPGFQLMALLRRELRPEMARLIRKLREQAPAAGDPVVGRWRNSRTLSPDAAIRLSVAALEEELDAPMLLVCFERRALAELASPVPAGEGDDMPALGTGALEEELATTREHLYTVIEELETSNEESQSLNEEIQTANEELQSTNEELEASNEELQASNEELTTVNEELQVKSQEWQAVSTELEGIYATVDFVLLAFDSQLLLRRFNRAGQRQLGASEVWLGRHVAALPWTDALPALAAACERVLAQGRSEMTQLVGVGQRDWLMRVIPRIGPEGLCVGVIVLMDDNTQSRAARAAALRSDAQLRQLVERSAQLVCICDSSGRLQLANPVFERCHGLVPGASVGKPIQDVLAPGRAGEFREALLEAMRLLQPLEKEEVLEIGGERRELLAAYYPLLDDEGAVSGVCYQALDITLRKQDQEALLEARSARLAAEGIARTKSAFLANMSHEIRTPMNAVLGLSRMVLQADLPPAVHAQVSQVHEAAQGLTRILDDVLDFSKMEAGALRFERHPFDLGQTLREVGRLFSANAREKGIRLVIDPLLGVPAQVVGDPLRLSQVLNNLVGNALKFTPAGEVRIGVSPADEAMGAGQCSLRFSVRDTGVGIPRAQRDALFEAFVQGDASITRRFGGTGLGLAICQRLVRLMNGRIGVNSEVGKGSEFWFTATFGTAPIDEPAIAAAPDGAGPADRVPVGCRVLLAEDNELNQIVGRAVLEQMGFEVEVVEDGAAALACIAARDTGHYGAVLMDLHMPVMGGLEATRRLRALPQGARLPVIALTAAAFSEDRDSCFEAGMNGHISKPLEPTQLLATLQRLRLPPGPAAEAAPRAAPEGLALTLPGFDLQPLLERMQGDESLVWTLLRGFVERERNTAGDIGVMLGQARVADARLRLHALTGSAATIGAALVARASASLDAVLEAGLDSPAALQSLAEALTASVKAVEGAGTTS